MCDKAHRYTVEVIGETPRYTGTDKVEALRALTGVVSDTRADGFVIAEHDLGDSTSYCGIETRVIKAEADMAAIYPEDFPELFQYGA
jgi:hypothetical protein